MTWSTIARPNPAAASLALDAVRVSWRVVSNGGYINIQIGADIARQLGLTEDRHPVRLMVGSDNNAGKLAIASDKGGEYEARRMGKAGGRGCYAIAVPKAAGFASGFPVFTRDRLEVVKPANGQPRYVSFLLTGQFLGNEE